MVYNLPPRLRRIKVFIRHRVGQNWTSNNPRYWENGDCAVFAASYQWTGHVLRRPMQRVTQRRNTTASSGKSTNDTNWCINRAMRIGQKTRLQSKYFQLRQEQFTFLWTSVQIFFHTVPASSQAFIGSWDEIFKFSFDRSSRPLLVAIASSV
jgi:hypothetical protein